MASLRNLRAAEHRASASAGPLDDFWYQAWPSKTSAGVGVDQSTALTLSVVWACVRILSCAVGKVPLHLYRRQKRGKERATDHALYSILHRRPTPFVTAFRWRQTLQGHLGTWGNAFAQIRRDGRGRVVDLPMLRPDRMRVARSATDGGPDYVYQPIGSAQFVPVPRKNVLHIPALGFDGLLGYSPVQQARESIGLGLGQEKMAAKLFGSGLNPGTIFKHPMKLGDTAYKRLKETLSDKSGVENAYDGIILEEGMDLARLNFAPEEGQFLESRQFQVVEICRWYGIQPHKVAELSRATFSNIEEQNIEHVVDTLQPWFVLWEQELSRALLAESEQEELFFEFDAEGLLRGNSAARAAFYRELWGIGGFTINQILERENMNAVDGGDERFVPLNMIPLSKLDDYLAAKASPPPAKPAPEDALEDVPEDPPEEVLSDDSRAVGAYRKVFLAAAQRVVNRETLAIERALKRCASWEEFDAWLSEFYAGDFSTAAHRDLGAVVDCYAELVGASVPSADDLTALHSARSQDTIRLIRRQANGDWRERIAGICGEWAASRADALAERVDPRWRAA